MNGMYSLEDSLNHSLWNAFMSVVISCHQYANFRIVDLCVLVGDTAEDRKTAADPASAKDEEDDAGKGPKEEVLQDAQARIPLEESGTWQEDIKQQTAAQPPQPSTDFVDSAFDFILNPDLEEAVEDYSSSEEESE